MIICLIVFIMSAGAWAIYAGQPLLSRYLLATGLLASVISAALRGRKRGKAYARIGRSSEKYEVPPMNFADVAANAEAKNSLRSLANYLCTPEKYSTTGARMPKGVLLYGPPGTGKTLLARALAGEANVPFFALAGSDFVQMYVGVGAKRVRDLFKKARKAGKCVIFIDEIDALGKKRGDSMSDERDQTLNALLSEMSGFRTGDGVVILAATNRIDVLDPALIRPGRFDRQIEVGLPDRSERLDILRLHCKDKPIANDVDLERLAADTCAFSGAALESLINDAAIIAAERDSTQIGNDDLKRAYVRTIAGEDRLQSANHSEKCNIALHEAGHAVALCLLNPEARIKRISILPAGRGAAGYNLAVPEEQVLITKDDLETKIKVLLAGRAAEMLINGSSGVTSGASGDIQKATELAGTMESDLAMLGSPSVSVRALRAYGGATNSESLIRAELDRLFISITELLTENCDILTDLTSELVEKETMDEDEISDFFLERL